MDTMVLIGCPVCGRRYRYDTARFGTRGVRLRCRSCEAVMKIDLSRDGAGDAHAEPALEAPAPEERESVFASEAAPDSDGSGPGVPPPATPAPPVGTLDAEAELRLEETFGPSPDQRPAALVADRDEGLRAVLAGALAEGGYEVHAVSDGLEARRNLAAPRLQLAFLNVYLPHVLGVTLCSEIKRHPELARIHVVLVGSLYRRDRFVRDPHEMYGADGFLDGSGSPEEMRARVAGICDGLGQPPLAEEPVEGDTRAELIRLARIVAGDIILYNPRIAEQEIAAGRFFVTFAQEVREGEALVAHRFPHLSDHRDLYMEALREAVEHHGEAAGIPVRAGH